MENTSKTRKQPMTNSVCEILDVEANTPQWLDARKSGISASDTPNLMVPDEAFGTPCTVYASKVLGYCTPMSTAMELGHVLEPVVAHEYHKRSPHNRIEPAGKLLKSTEYPWLLATPDYWAFINGRDLAVLEIKTTHERNRRKWRDGVPVAYQLQVQQQMLVTGLKQAVVAVGFVKTETYTYLEEHGDLDGCDEPVSGLEYFTIEADPAVQVEIIAQTQAFWEDHIRAQVPPVPLTADDIKIVYPPVKGKEIEGSVIDAGLLGQRRRLDAQIDELKQRRDRIDVQLKLAMKDAEILTVDGNPAVTWRQSTRNAFDTATFKANHPSQYQNYLKRSTARTFLVKGER